MSLTSSFKSANSLKAGMRTRRYDRKFSNPKFKPKFRARKRRFSKPKR